MRHQAGRGSTQPTAKAQKTHKLHPHHSSCFCCLLVFSAAARSRCAVNRRGSTRKPAGARPARLQGIRVPGIPVRQDRYATTPKGGLATRPGSLPSPAFLQGEHGPRVVPGNSIPRAALPIGGVDRIGRSSAPRMPSGDLPHGPPPDEKKSDAHCRRTASIPGQARAAMAQVNTTKPPRRGMGTTTPPHHPTQRPRFRATWRYPARSRHRDRTPRRRWKGTEPSADRRGCRRPGSTKEA